MNVMQHSYRDNHDNQLHYRDITIFIITQPYHMYSHTHHYIRIYLASWLTNDKIYVDTSKTITPQKL